VQARRHAGNRRGSAGKDKRMVGLNPAATESMMGALLRKVTILSDGYSKPSSSAVRASAMAEIQQISYVIIGR
jgi:hypothetical protein